MLDEIILQYQSGPKSSDKCPYKKKREKTHRRRPCEDRDGDWSYVCPNQGTPGGNRSWKRQERGIQECGPDDNLISDF